MRAVSQDFLDALGTSHQIATEVKILQTDRVLENVVDCRVTLDSTASIRGSLDLMLIDDGTLGLIPTTPFDELAPYGNEIQVKRGVRFADGSTEMVSLGVFRIETVEVTDTGQGTQIAISGLDRAARVIDARFDTPGQVDATTTASTAIEEVITGGFGQAEFDFEDVPYGLPKVTWEEGADRWEFAQRLATMAGAELFFDGDGILVLRTIPSPSDAPVAFIAEGQNGVLLSVAKRWTREEAFNRVIVTGESMDTGVPYRGDAYDDDSESPTYYFGDFGKVIRFERSDVVGSAAQAESAAVGFLARNQGTFSEIQFGSVTLPHLEPGDVVRVTRSSLGIDEQHVVDQLDIPLLADGDMTGKTRGVTANG